MTIGSVAAGGTIQASWGNSVADQLNNLPPAIQWGTWTGNTNSSGWTGGQTFPEAFASTPLMWFSVHETDSQQQITAQRIPSAMSATGWGARILIDGVRVDSDGPFTIDWIAIGTLA